MKKRLMILALLAGWAIGGIVPAYAGNTYQTIPTRTPEPEATATNPPAPPGPPGGESTPEPTTAATETTPQATATPVDLAATPEGGYLPTAAPCDLPTVQALSTVNVRQGPGQDYEIVGTLVYLQVQSITGRATNAPWWQITLPGDRIGWVADAAVAVQGNIAYVPPVSAPPLDGGTPTPGPVWNPTPDPTCPPVPTPTATATSAPPSATPTTPPPTLPEAPC